MRAFLAALVLLALPVSAETGLTDAGLHSQPWFLQSFLQLQEDIAEAEGAGKRLAVVFEQRGCSYCRDMHEVNLADERIVAFIRERFEIVQLNLHGAREMTDLDGAVLAEKDLARKWRITFTPTIVFLGPGGEVARVPGYLEPASFLGMFRWVAEGRTATPLRQYLAESKGRS